MEIKSKVRVFNGHLIRFSHPSNATQTIMTAAIYIPFSTVEEEADNIKTTATTTTFPTLLYLSGLTCSDENVCTKGGPLFQVLSDLNMVLIAPDTSPRNTGIDGETASWDFGVGAGFYLNATQTPWSKNFNMYSYILEDLMNVIREHFPCVNLQKMGITGHSMGGHGALTLALKNPTLFKSVSAFAPICHPILSPWGIKAFTGYLGEDNKEDWKQYDATELILAMKSETVLFKNILIDIGLSDSFYTGKQLLPEDFHEACIARGQPITLRFQEGFDHSYYFVSSFIEEHIRYHYTAVMSNNNNNE